MNGVKVHTTCTCSNKHYQNFITNFQQGFSDLDAICGKLGLCWISISISIFELISNLLKQIEMILLFSGKQVSHFKGDVDHMPSVQVFNVCPQYVPSNQQSFEAMTKKTQNVFRRIELANLWHLEVRKWDIVLFYWAVNYIKYMLHTHPTNLCSLRMKIALFDECVLAWQKQEMTKSPF